MGLVKSTLIKAIPLVNWNLGWRIDAGTREYSKFPPMLSFPKAWSLWCFPNPVLSAEYDCRTIGWHWGEFLTRDGTGRIRLHESWSDRKWPLYLTKRKKLKDERSFRDFRMVSRQKAMNRKSLWGTDGKVMVLDEPTHIWIGPNRYQIMPFATGYCYKAAKINFSGELNDFGRLPLRDCW